MVGQYLAVQCTLFLSTPPPAGGLHVDLQSSSGLMNLALNATDSGGTTLGVDMTSQFGSFYLQALGSSGPATITGTATGYAPSTTSTTMSPSGFVILGQSSVSVGAHPLMQISAVRLDATGAVADYSQVVAGSQIVSVPLTSSAPAVGTVPAGVNVAGGTSSSTATFSALTAGPNSCLGGPGGGLGDPEYPDVVNNFGALTHAEVLGGECARASRAFPAGAAPGHPGTGTLRKRSWLQTIEVNDAICLSGDRRRHIDAGGICHARRASTDYS